jgi:hypothetical protein
LIYETAFDSALWPGSDKACRHYEDAGGLGIHGQSRPNL